MINRILPNNNFLIIVLLTVSLILTSSCNQKSIETSEVELCVGDYVTEEEAVEKLKEFASTYSNVDEWRERAESIKENIRLGAELDELDEADWSFPIKITRGKSHQLDGYSVENLALEVKPEYFVYGNLYLPEHFDGKIPAVLCPHGHWFDLEDYGRFRPDMQKRCAALARMGAAVFTLDMFGSGEDIYNDHMDPKALQKQVYNNIRALDFISLLDYVDNERIGVTGASGGGTQTFLLAAIDDRIAVSVPTVMVSAHYYGGCVCESRMPIHKRGSFETNNVEIAASIAPKPLMLISDGGDWTSNVPDVEYPYIKRIYEMFGAGNQVENAHFADEGHDYGISKRKASYKFLAKHLNLDYDRILDSDGNVNEQFVTILDTSDMQVFPSRNLVVNPQHY